MTAGAQLASLLGTIDRSSYKLLGQISYTMNIQASKAADSALVRHIPMILPVHSGVVSQLPLAKQDTVADPDRVYPLLHQ